MINKYIVIFLLRKNLQPKKPPYYRQVSKIMIITELGVNEYNLKKKILLLCPDERPVNSIKIYNPVQFITIPPVIEN